MLTPMLFKLLATAGIVILVARAQDPETCRMIRK